MLDDTGGYVWFPIPSNFMVQVLQVLQMRLDACDTYRGMGKISVVPTGPTALAKDKVYISQIPNLNHLLCSMKNGQDHFSALSENKLDIGYPLNQSIDSSSFPKNVI